MKLRVFGNRVLVREDDEEQRSHGLIIPEVSRKKQMQGTVISAGDGDDVEVKEGDRIVYSKFSGLDVKFDDGKLKLMDTAGVLALMEEE